MSRRSMFLIFLVLALTGLATFPPLHAQPQGKLLQTFSLKEVFGVSHPKQIVDFDFAQNIDPQSTYMIGPEGVEVAYQILRNRRIDIQTDLPENADRTWKLYAGKAPAPVKGGVQVIRRDTYYEITKI